MGGLILLGVMIAWVWFCIWFARKLVSWLPMKLPIVKFIIGVLVVALLIPLPLIDEIIGKFQFDRLCREEAGVKIFGKLELGPEFFNTDGTPNFFAPNGEIDERMKRIIKITELPIENTTGAITIHRHLRQIVHQEQAEVLATRTGFSTSGGWLSYDRRPWLIRSKCFPSESIFDVLRGISRKHQLG